jgi:hypothetical protein
MREMDSKRIAPYPNDFNEIGELTFRSWYRACGEKCILRPQSRTTEAALPNSPERNHRQIPGKFGYLRGQEVRRPKFGWRSERDSK